MECFVLIAVIAVALAVNHGHHGNTGHHGNPHPAGHTGCATDPTLCNGCLGSQAGYCHDDVCYCQDIVRRNTGHCTTLLECVNHHYPHGCPIGSRHCKLGQCVCDNLINFGRRAVHGHSNQGHHHPHPEGHHTCSDDTQCSGCPAGQQNMCNNGVCHCYQAPVRRAACNTDLDCATMTCQHGGVSHQGGYCHGPHLNQHGHSTHSYCSCHIDSSCQTDTDCARFCTNGTSICHHNHGHARCTHCQHQ